MTPRSASSPHLRRRRLWLRVVLAVILIAPLLVFLLSNAWLQTSWGKNWVAQQISQRTGIPVQISGAGWLPGGQVWINDLQVLAPSPSLQDPSTPLLHIRCVSIRPAWSAWLRGSRKISDVHLTAPRLHISLETLKSILPAPAATPPATPPTVAENPPPPGCPRTWDATSAPCSTNSCGRPRPYHRPCPRSRAAFTHRVAENFRWLSRVDSFFSAAAPPRNQQHLSRSPHRRCPRYRTPPCGFPKRPQSNSRLQRSNQPPLAIPTLGIRNHETQLRRNLCRHEISSWPSRRVAFFRDGSPRTAKLAKLRRPVSDQPSSIHSSPRRISNRSANLARGVGLAN